MRNLRTKAVFFIFSIFVAQFLILNIAAAQGAATFTIYPSYTHQGNKAWFIYDVKPGDTVKDYLTLENLSDTELKLKIYFLEGQEDNGKMLTKEGNGFSDIGALMSPAESYVDLQPKQKKKVEFLYTIPKDFKEGRYAGVFYAEQFGNSDAMVAVNTRIGVRTFVNVNSRPVAGEGFGLNVYQMVFLAVSITLVAVTFLWGVSQKNGRGHKKLMMFAIVLFMFNFLPLAEAQNMEIEVEGAGYRILGPDEIILPDVTASFSSQQSTVDFEDLTGTGQDLEIIDENGGVPFSVNVASTDLSGNTSSISNTNVEIKNYDGDGDTITLVQGASDQVSLSSDTDAFASLDVSRTLFQANSDVLPGQWRIYPSIRVTIPAGTAPGTYRSTLTFTIN